MYALSVSAYITLLQSLRPSQGGPGSHSDNEPLPPAEADGRVDDGGPRRVRRPGGRAVGSASPAVLTAAAD